MVGLPPLLCFLQGREGYLRSELAQQSGAAASTQTGPPCTDGIRTTQDVAVTCTALSTDLTGVRGNDRHSDTCAEELDQVSGVHSGGAAYHRRTWRFSMPVRYSPEGGVS